MDHRRRFRTIRRRQREPGAGAAHCTDGLVRELPRALPELNLEVGQIKIPLSLENRTSENITPFLENSLAVRNLGAPTVRDIGAMLWGEAAERLVYYAVGIFNGDGPNRPNQDANFDGIGRVVVHPFARGGVKELEGLEFGASLRYGVRSAKTVGYEVNAFTTQGGFAFWRPRYTDSKNELIHVIPSSAQRAYAAELYFPIAMVDLSAEVVAVDQGTREAIDGYALAWPFTERYGTLAGFAHYVELGVWVFGDRQFVRKPGYLDPVHVDFSQPLRPSRNSLEVLARFEQLRVRYYAAARAGTLDPMTPNRDIRVDTVSFGVNYWATRRVRLSLNYELNSFPDGVPALHGGHVLHELGLRVGVGF